MYIKDTSGTAISIAELISELTPAAQKNLKTACRYVSTSEWLSKLALYIVVKYFISQHLTVRMVTILILFLKIRAPHQEFQTFTTRLQARCKRSKNSVALSPQDQCFMESGIIT